MRTTDIKSAPVIRVGKWHSLRAIAAAAAAVGLSLSAISTAGPAAAVDQTLPQCSVDTTSTLCVQSITPAKGQAGGGVEIVGKGIGGFLEFDENSITFGTQAATQFSVSGQNTDEYRTISVVAPSQPSVDPGTVDIAIITSGFDRLIVGQFTYEAPVAPPSKDVQDELKLRACVWKAFVNAVGGELTADQTDITVLQGNESVAVWATSIWLVMNSEQISQFDGAVENCESVQQSQSFQPSSHASARSAGVAGTVSYTVNGKYLCKAQIANGAAACKGKVAKFKGNPEVSSTFTGTIAGVAVTFASTPKKIKASPLAMQKAQLKKKGKNRALTLKGLSTKQNKPVKVSVKQGKKFVAVKSVKPSKAGKWALTQKFAASKLKGEVVVFKVEHAGKKLLLQLG